MGGDSEIRQMNNGEKVISFSMATTESWRDKLSQEKKEQTEWHRIVVYGKLAEIVSKYAKKGSQLYIEGRLRTRKWVDQNQINRFTTEIVASEIHILANRNSFNDNIYDETVDDSSMEQIFTRIE
jgi:single-strand DNA-binding protein